METTSDKQKQIHIQIVHDLDNDSLAPVSITTNNSKRSKRRKKNREEDALQIDSKELSVQQVRPQPPATCIDLQPEQPPFSLVFQGSQGDQTKLYFSAPLPEDILTKPANQLTRNDLSVLFQKLIIGKDGTVPDVIEAPSKFDLNTNPYVHPQAAAQFQNLFNETFDKISRGNQQPVQNQPPNLHQLVQQVEQVQVADGQVLQLPEEIGKLVTNKVQLLQTKTEEICQQFILITYNDIITGDEERHSLRSLMRSNFKEQICHYITSRVAQIDQSYNYHNVDVLKMIHSKWVWDNTIPFMAECLYKDADMSKARLLPQKSNKDSVTVLKYQIFLIMSQMFFGVLPRQIATYDLPISFGHIMMLGENDSALIIQNKKAKLRSVLHYFSSVLREKESTIKNSVQFMAFQRFRINLKTEALYPMTKNDELRYGKLILTDHMELATVKYGNEFLKQTAVYLTDELLCRESNDEQLQISVFMQQTYRLMYSKPEMFIIKALTPRLDLGQAIIIHGLEQFSRCSWKQQGVEEQGEQYFASKIFECHGLYNEQTQIDSYGKRVGTVILIMSKLLFSQSIFKTQQSKINKISQGFSFREIKRQIETLYSAFQGRKVYCNQQQRILISERYLKFVEDDFRWLYFLIVWIASSLAKVRVVFQFKHQSDRVEAFYLMKHLEGWTIKQVLELLSKYRETMVEAHEKWSRQVEQMSQPPIHEWNIQQSQNIFDTQSQLPQPMAIKNRIVDKSFLDYMKNVYF